MVFDTEDIDEDKKKKALLQLWGGDKMIRTLSTKPWKKYEMQ